ncbi:MAG: phosphoribosylformylglycinamidine synthase subunit PurQ [Deltaproteobacteria bacterium]|nr:phosphoribosylformylglycinamidine synthase subunit PurQ [Deltaproteobacteria bacterium]
MKWGVVVFPASNCDYDAYFALKNILKCEVEFLWHKERNLKNVDVVVLPGGFSYGDYLRCGAMARFSPVMEEVISFANKGHPVMGICNGFQVLTEAGLLEGTLMKNKTLKFMCKQVWVKSQTTQGVWSHNTEKNKVLKMPIAHGEGNYFVTQEKLKELEDNDQIAFRYCDEKGEVLETSNPNGSVSNIAGVYNKNKNILGLMPHPERACESILGSEDGRVLLESVL